MNKDTEIKRCKNCENSIEDNFCGHCGQKAKIEKISAKFFFKEIGGSIFYADKGFLFTIKELAVRPGKAVKEFIEGKRIIYFKPVSFVLIFTILYSFLLYLFDTQTEVQSMLSGIKEAIIEKGNNQSGQGIFQWFINNYAYSILLLCPVFSAASYLSFYRSKRSYAENLLMNLFLIGEISLFLILLFPLTIFFNDSHLLILFKILAVLCYTCFSFYQFFDSVKKVSRFINTIMTFILFLFFFAIEIFVFVVVYNY